MPNQGFEMHGILIDFGGKVEIKANILFRLQNRLSNRPAQIIFHVYKKSLESKPFF